MRFITLPIPELRKHVSYDPATGEFTWVVRTVVDRLGRTQRRRSEQPFTIRSGSGYLVGTVLGVRLFAHRCAVALYFGEWPEQEVDHINGVRDDNRMVNLREVSPTQNRRNMGVTARSASGVLGVSWQSSRRKWRACITVDNKHVHLGRFDCVAEAIKARKCAEREHGFHENHGTRKCL